MFSPPTPPEHEIAFRDGALDICVSVSDEGVARLVRLFAPASDGASSDAPNSAGQKYLPGLPLVDVITSGSGRAWSGGRYIESVTGGRLRHAASEQHTRGKWQELTFRLEDPDSGLRSEVAYRVSEAEAFCARAPGWRTRVRRRSRSSLSLRSSLPDLPVQAAQSMTSTSIGRRTTGLVRTGGKSAPFATLWQTSTAAFTIPTLGGCSA